MTSTLNSKPGEDVRSSARERAVHFLYEAESRSLPVSEIIAAQILAVDNLVSLLTSGVSSRQPQLDEMITEY